MAAFFLLKKGFEEYKVIKQSENAIFYPRFNLLVLCCRVLCPVASIVISSLRPRTVAHQAPWSRGFYRQKYWSGLLCPLPGVLPNPGIKPISPASPALQADSLPSEPSGKPNLLGEMQLFGNKNQN